MKIIKVLTKVNLKNEVPQAFQVSSSENARVDCEKPAGVFEKQFGASLWVE